VLTVESSVMVIFGLRHLITCLLCCPFIIFIFILDKVKFVTEAMPIFSFTLVYGRRVGRKDFTVRNHTMYDRPCMV